MIGDVLDLGRLVVVGEDHRVALPRQPPDLCRPVACPPRPGQPRPGARHRPARAVGRSAGPRDPPRSPSLLMAASLLLRGFRLIV